MLDWRLLCKVRDAPNGTMARIPFPDEQDATPTLFLLVSEVDGSYHAIEDKCGYAGCRLSRGDRTDHTVTCARDWSEFDVRDGSVVQDAPERSWLERLAYGNAPRGTETKEVLAYTLKADGDTVYIKIDPKSREPIAINAPPPPPPPPPSPSSPAPAATATAPPGGPVAPAPAASASAGPAKA